MNNKFAACMRMLAIFMAAFAFWNLTFFLRWIFNAGAGEEADFYFTLREMVYGRVTDTETECIVSMFGNLESIVFSVLYGTYLYKQVDIQGIYSFVRQRGRKRWFLKAACRLFLITGLWSFMQVAAAFIAVSGFTKTGCSIQTAELFVIIYLMTVLFNFFMVYLINLVSIKYGSVMSFIMVYLILLISFFSGSIKADEAPRLLIYFLPTESHLPQWNPQLSVSAADFLELNKNTFVSIFVLLAYIIILTAVVFVCVDYWDIGLENRENKFL